MGFFDLTVHLLNFCAPAVALAVLLPIFPQFSKRKVAKMPVYYAQAAIIFIATLPVSLVGLWYFGNDGKMATYAAMVVVAATTQFVLRKGWK